MNLDDFLAEMDFGSAEDSEALRYLRLDMIGGTTRAALAKMLEEAIGKEDWAKIRAGADALQAFVYSMASVQLYGDDPAAAYVKAAIASGQTMEEAVAALEDHRNAAVELVRMATVVRDYLPDSSGQRWAIGLRPVNDLAELRVSSFWEVGFPFIVTVGSYVHSGAGHYADNFVRSMEGGEFLAWVDNELLVFSRLAVSSIGIIDEAIYRIQNGGLTNEM